MTLVQVLTLEVSLALVVWLALVLRQSLVLRLLLLRLVMVLRLNLGFLRIDLLVDDRRSKIGLLGSLDCGFQLCNRLFGGVSLHAHFLMLGQQRSNNGVA